MKEGTRVFIDDAKIISVEGNTHEFKKGDSIEVEVITRKSGRCVDLASAETFSCKNVRGMTNLA